MKRCITGVIAAVLLFGLPKPGFSEAKTQVDSLIELLVKKDIISQDEGEKLKGEIAYDESTLRAENNKKDVPAWVQNMKLSGDFRLRHEYSKRNDSTDLDRNRGRLRYRLGLETKVNDQTKVAFGIASGSGDPRSTNQTFQDTFSKKTLNIDYAFAQYKPNDILTFTGGKMKIPFWEPGDLLWDTDLTPEGGAVNIDYKLNDAIKLFSSIDVFIMDELSADQSDPFMYVLQSGVQGNLGEKADYKLAGTYFGFDNGTKSLLDNRSSPTTNSVTGGRYDWTYNVGSIFGELGINDPFGENFSLYIPRIGIFGEYANNPKPDDNNVSWLLGGYMGNSKVGGKGQWKTTGSYRALGKDAWLDALPDSDFYGGATDVKGYETIFEYGIASNVILGVDYYRTERIKTTKAPESVLQTDINFKF